MRRVSFRLLIVILSFILSLYLSLPNFMECEYFQSNKLKLGLDIRGGISFLLEADLSSHKKDQIHMIKESLARELKIKNAKVNNNKIEFESEVEKLPEALDRIVGKGLYIVNNHNGNSSVVIKNEFFTLEQANIINRIIDVLRYRIDANGMQEISIQRQGDDSVLVQIPGAEDVSSIKNVLSQTGSLKFHMVDMNATMDDELSVPLGVKLLPMKINDEKEIKIPVFTQPVMTGDMIANANAAAHMGKHVVTFKLNDIGTRKFAEITRNNAGKAMAIVLDNKIVTAPMINEPILNGSGQITGNFTFETARQTAVLLRSGSLPVPVKIVQESLIGPTLGREAVQSGAEAVVIGCLAVIAVMLIVYKGLGFIASIGLICNLTMMLGILSLSEATLTLPGIAGMALTLGMAVDANVLIYERMKEEIKNKKSSFKAIMQGYDIALRTILDSNITTVIVALLLYVFGSSAIKGFSITLIIGIICSMITAVVFTKILIEAWYHLRRDQKSIV